MQATWLDGFDKIRSQTLVIADTENYHLRSPDHTPFCGKWFGEIKEIGLPQAENGPLSFCDRCSGLMTGLEPPSDVEAAEQGLWQQNGLFT